MRKKYTLRSEWSAETGARNIRVTDHGRNEGSILDHRSSEVQVIQLIAAGRSNEEVGRELGISPRTAKAHCDTFRLSSACRGGGRSRSRIGS